MAAGENVPASGGLAQQPPPIVRNNDLSLAASNSNLHAFTYAELRAATAGFSRSRYLGCGGFGPVYKGAVDDKLRPGLAAQAVAVKYLDLECGTQGHKEWLVSAEQSAMLAPADQFRGLVHEWMTYMGCSCRLRFSSLGN